jgi:hypothetical protein
MSACIWSRSFPIVFLLAENWFDDGKSYTEMSAQARETSRSAHLQTDARETNQESELKGGEWSNGIHREAV